MKKSIKYAALNIGILLMGVCLLAFAGAAIEGGIGFFAALAVCLCLAAAMRLAWKEITHMERMARQLRRVRRTRRVQAEAVRETPDLRVA